MTCNETLEQLIAFEEGDLDSLARPPLEQHLADCAACREELSLLRGSWDLLPAWEGLQPSEGLTARIMAAVQAPVVVSLEEQREARRKPPMFAERTLSQAWVARLATAASIAIILGTLLWPVGPSPSGGAAPVAYQTAVLDDVVATWSAEPDSMLDDDVVAVLENPAAEEAQPPLEALLEAPKAAPDNVLFEIVAAQED